MIMQNIRILKFFRCLAVLCTITIGFITIVATSDDDVADVIHDAGIDLGISKDVNLEVDRLTLTSGGEVCKSVNIKNKLEEAGVDAIVEAAIKKININDILVSYRATWDPVSVTDFTCTLIISGDSGSATFTATPINNNTGTPTGFQTINPDPEALSVVDGYLQNRDQTIEFCIECSGLEEIENMDLEYDIILDTHIEA